MRGTNKTVANSWRHNKDCTSGNGNYRTDGYNLWSYRMLIGRTLPDGTKEVLDVRGKYGYSATTSRHVSLAMGAGIKIITPIVTHQGWSSWREFPTIEFEPAFTFKKIAYLTTSDFDMWDAAQEFGVETGRTDTMDIHLTDQIAADIATVQEESAVQTKTLIQAFRGAKALGADILAVTYEYTEVYDVSDDETIEHRAKL